MLTLHPRFDFAGQPWPQPVTSFSLDWLKGTFLPAQQARRARVTAAITEGEARVAKARKEAVGNVPLIGERRSDGSVYQTGADQQMQQHARTIAERQTVEAIRKIREEIDDKCLEDLKSMERAAITARTLSERVFDKLSCLGRVSAGMNAADLAAFKSHTANLVRGVAAIELHRLAQNAIDAGDPLSLVMLDVIRTENFGRKKDDRPFLNQSLLDLISVPEFDAAVGTEERPGLLRQVVALHKETGTAWASFLGKIGQASVMRIARGLATVKLSAAAVGPDAE